MRCAFAVFLLAATACAEAPVEHIVLVTLDTHRADVIVAYGSPAGRTSLRSALSTKARCGTSMSCWAGCGTSSARRAADPSESVPLVGSEAGSRDQMRDAALGQRDGLGKSRLGGIEPGLLEELRELGYVE